jgi:hypothetical protein
MWWNQDKATRCPANDGWDKAQGAGDEPSCWVVKKMGVEGGHKSYNTGANKNCGASTVWSERGISCRRSFEWPQVRRKGKESGQAR